MHINTKSNLTILDLFNHVQYFALKYGYPQTLSQLNNVTFLFFKAGLKQDLFSNDFIDAYDKYPFTWTKFSVTQKEIHKEYYVWTPDKIKDTSYAKYYSCFDKKNKLTKYLISLLKDSYHHRLNYVSPINQKKVYTKLIKDDLITINDIQNNIKGINNNAI